MEETYIKSTDKDYWVRSVLNKGQKPIFNILSEVDKENWDVIESFWINYYSALNPCMVNKSVGGKKNRKVFEKYKPIKYLK